ncbi:thiamine pyrophosphate-binding protein [Candidatus Microgenomates bacterium]|nr:thiamine pyrophosphate-binding protein [Candidatus Microgenomates bacterium]
MKLSDYVVKFIKDEVADSVFVLSGGGIMHIIDSLGKSNINTYCCHHEQGAVIAAEGYGRIRNHPGVAVVTTGPGGTNAITGVAGAWLDSVPMMVICGQVKTDNITPRSNGIPAQRAIGLQELNNTDIARPITKYTVTVTDPDSIKYHLQKALHIAISGRPGPVWIEIPLDITTAEIDPEKLQGYKPKPLSEFVEPKIPMDIIIEKLKKAKKPLLMAGYGIRLAGGVQVLEKILKKYEFNVVTPIFTADDLVTHDYVKYLGRQGMPGNYSANYAVDNCDVLLVVGERIQLTQTSFDYKNFAIQATKIMVDIDESELYKKTLAIDIPVHCDAKIFLEELLKYDFKLNKWNVERDKINLADYSCGKKYLNVYKFIDEIEKYSGLMPISTADGMASLVPHQALRIHKRQRFITNAGLGHMGSGLPMAIGACIAEGKRPTICFEGDGSIMLNIQELQTIIYHKLPIKIFIFSNDGYYSIRGTHTRFFNKVFAADPSSGVGMPDFSKLILAWGLKYEKIASDDELIKLKSVMDYEGPIVCELMISPNQPMLPKWTAGQLRDK